MLTWVEEEVESPYGSVRTRHWAVPTSLEGSEEKTEDDGEEGLEQAEDQLGAVLWNSNGAALRWLHDHVLASLKGRRIVELGAGVGCLGIALAMGGATVCITDLKELLPLIRYNIELNQRRVQQRSGGIGHCEALEWRWGPSESINIRKRLKKLKMAPENRGDDNKGKNAKGDAALVSAVAKALHAIQQPSLAMRGCQGIFSSHNSINTADGDGNGKRKRTRGNSSERVSMIKDEPPIDLVILCDALYGNPKDWPSLVYTLSEILETNPNECCVVNFCEQRVADVEGPFLKLLEAENAMVALSKPSRWNAQEDAKFVARALIDRCRGDEPAGDVDLEQLNQAILAEVARGKRGGVYRWNFSTTTLGAGEGGCGKSDLGMIIHATRITWRRKKATQRSDELKVNCRNENVDENPVSLSVPAPKRFKNEIN